jgi:hypothetical protein
VSEVRREELTAGRPPAVGPRGEAFVSEVRRKVLAAGRLPLVHAGHVRYKNWLLQDRAAPPEGAPPKGKPPVGRAKQRKKWQKRAEGGRAPSAGDAPIGSPCPRKGRSGRAGRRASAKPRVHHPAPNNRPGWRQLVPARTASPPE